MASVPELIPTNLVTDPTRAVLQARLAGKVSPDIHGREHGAGSVLPIEAMTVLRAVAARFFPTRTAAMGDLAAALDARLASGTGDGWRYDRLPPDEEAHRRGLLGLNDLAQARGADGFAELTGDQQDAVLRDVQSGAAVLPTLDGATYLEELLAELTAMHAAHPLVQNHMGHLGMADAKGWRRIGLDEREPWEHPDATPDAGRTLPDAEAYTPPLGPMRQYATSDEVDAVIIGTGAGGAPMLARLAAGGWRVVGLEAGPMYDPTKEFATDERAQEKLFWTDERLSAGADPLAFGANNSGTGVGGSTLHFTAYTPRPRAADFHLHRDFSVGHDWPLSYADLVPYYDEVERFLGVSGPSPYPWEPERTPYPLAPLPLNGAAQLMERACRTLGLRTAPAANAALSAPYVQPGIGRRPACTNRGFCQAGCSVGAKGSMDVTYLPLAVAHGAEIRPGAFVTGFDRAADGRITAVIYQRDGVEHRQKCRHVVLAAGAVETPRLLLLNELATGSGQVGRNLMAHPGIQLWGRFAERVAPWKGIPGGLISEDTHRPADADFAGGYLLQSIGVMPVTYATQVARGRGLFGAALDDHLSGYVHTAGINILGDCLPSDENFLELSGELDGRGLPKPRVHFTNGPNERRMTAHAEATMRAIWTEAGGADLWSFDRSAHVIGTCRMGTDGADSVVNPWGRSHEIPNLTISDNSTFPSALPVNPALTIIALALRSADHLLGRTH